MTQHPNEKLLREMAMLLERGQRILMEAGLTTNGHLRTPEEIRVAPRETLRQDPRVWSAYNRGKEDQTAAFQLALRSTTRPTRGTSPMAVQINNPARTATPAHTNTAQVATTARGASTSGRGVTTARGVTMVRGATKARQAITVSEATTMRGATRGRGIPRGRGNTNATQRTHRQPATSHHQPASEGPAPTVPASTTYRPTTKAKTEAVLERARERRRQHRREKRRADRAMLRAEREGPSQQYRLAKPVPATETPPLSESVLNEPGPSQASEGESEIQEEPMEIGDQVLDTPRMTLPVIQEVDEDQPPIFFSPPTSPREN